LKKWLSITCPVCGFRHPLSKFRPEMQPILYPAQIVTGGGRAKGFRVEKYLPWTTLPTLKQTNAWNSLLFLYGRLADAYDHFYEVLGFLSPEIKRMLQELQKPYSHVYKTSPFTDYFTAYARTESFVDVAKAYEESNYADAYAYGAILVPEGG
jgi:hypothetical protein